MKILILVDKFKGGSGNMAQIIASELSKKSHDVILALTNDYEKKTKSRYLWTGVNVVYLQRPDYRNKLTLLREKLKSWLSLFRKVRPDVVVSFIIDNNIFSTIAAQQMNIPVIISERSNPIAVKAKFPLRLMQWLTYRKADIVAVQFDCFKGFLSNVRAERYRCLPNVVLKNTAPKRDYHTDDGVFRIIAVGNLRPIKNYPGMLNIIKSAKQRGLNVVLDIYGEGNQRETLESIIKSYNLSSEVRLKGHILNIHDILQMYDCYIMTSFQEGFPNALSEAMATGLPCISYKCHDGLSELINNGHNGYLVQFGNEELFTDIIERLYNNITLRETVGNNAKEISGFYSTDRVMTIWEQCILDAIYIHNELYKKN